MDVKRQNWIMNAVADGVPEDEACENDDERLTYRLLKRQMENPATSHLGFQPIADQP